MVTYTFTLAQVQIFILILVRISCFVYTAPFFSTSNVPSRVKIGLAVFVSFLLYGTVAELTTLEYTGLIGYAVIVLKEGITGLMIGFVANLCNSIILFAGHIVSMDIGLSMATEFDINMNTETTVISELYYYFVLLLLIATNMERYILQAIADSYTLIPINGQVFNVDGLLLTITTYMTDSFVIAFRIVLPVFACIMILNCILGVMARVAPQMNMFAVGMQMKILVGMAVMFITVTIFTGVADRIFSEMKILMTDVMQSLY